MKNKKKGRPGRPPMEVTQPLLLGWCGLGAGGDAVEPVAVGDEQAVIGGDWRG